MAKLISPGVAIVEKDFSTIIPNVSSSFGGIAGRFVKGPVLDPVLISKEDELELIFGRPNTENATEWHTAAEFLKYADRLWVVRAARANAKNAAVNIDGSPVVNTFFANRDDWESVDFTDQGDFIAKEPGADGNRYLVLCVDNSNWADFVAFCTTKESVDGYFPNNQGWHRYVNGGPTTSSFVQERTGASDVNDEIHIFVIDSVGEGSVKKNSILEVFEGVSVCADARTENGASLYYPVVLDLNSNYILAGTNPVPDDVATISSASTGITASSRASNIVSITTTTDHGFTVGQTVSVDVTFGAGVSGGVTSVDSNNALILSVPNSTTFTYAMVGADYTDADSTGTATRSAVNSGVSWGSSVERVYGGAKFAPSVDIDFTTATTLIGGANGTASTEQQIMDAYDKLASVEEIDVNLIMTAAYNDVITKHVAENVVAARKDAIGFISPHTNAGVSGDRIKTSILSSTISYKNTDLGLADNVGMYNFMDSGWKYIYDKYNNLYRWVPLNGDMAGLCARTSATNDDWWSPAGYNRGGLKNVLKLSYNPNNADRDELYRNSINSVISVAGSGSLLFGDKTMTSKPSAFDRINVRRLFNVLQKSIATAAKYSLFEFNDTFTRSQFRSMVEPFLRSVQGRRGITVFSVVCDESNNTPDVIDRNEFVAEILIQPARSINFITLNFVATRTGVDFSTVIGG